MPVRAAQPWIDAKQRKQRIYAPPAGPPVALGSPPPAPDGPASAAAHPPRIIAGDSDRRAPPADSVSMSPPPCPGADDRSSHISVRHHGPPPARHTLDLLGRSCQSSQEAGDQDALPAPAPRRAPSRPGNPPGRPRRSAAPAPHGLAGNLSPAIKSPAIAVRVLIDKLVKFSIVRARHGNGGPRGKRRELVSGTSEENRPLQTRDSIIV